MAEHKVWTVEYAPRSVKDLIIPPKAHKVFLGYLADAKKGVMIPNFTLASVQPGVGKTTSCRVLFEEAGYEILLFDGSKAGDRGISGMSEKVEPFALGSSISGAPRVVIIDEADNLTKDAQLALRGIINRASEAGSASFALTCNYLPNILDPILSRCPVIDFNYSTQEEVEGGIKKVVKRLLSIIKREGFDDIVSDKHKVATIIKIAKSLFPDIRQIFTEVQTYVYTGEVRKRLSANGTNDYGKELFELVWSEDKNAIITTVEENRLGDMAPLVVKSIVDYGFDKKGVNNGAWGFVVMPLAAKYLDMMNNSVDPAIALLAFLFDLMEKVSENREYIDDSK